MFIEEDIEFLTKNGFTIAPAQPHEIIENFGDLPYILLKNPFRHLENSRFIQTEFVRFSDEQRQLIHATGIYDCFGKSGNEFFVISRQDKGVYLITPSPYYSLFGRINSDIHTFSLCYGYFLATIYRIIAELNSITEEDEVLFNEQKDKICRKAVTAYVKNLRKIDPVALPTDKLPSFWWTLRNMMLEADLAFSLDNVSWTTYIDSGRFQSNF